MTIFVCFEGKITAADSAIGEQYYSTLQELLKHQHGFISETPFLSVDRPGQQVLIAEFADEASLHAWRKQHTHLQIESKARANLFVDYRIRSGAQVLDNDIAQDADGGKDTVSKGSYLILHQYPAGPSSKPVGPKSALDIPSEIWLSLIDAATYRGEKMLQVLSLRSLADARKVRDSMPRTEGDSIHLIHVKRDYGKYHREEAPNDADEAQAAAVKNEE